MTEAKIRSMPDEELQCRSQTVKANNKELVTPIKAVDVNKLDNSLSMSLKVRGITEIYFGLGKNKILDHLQGEDHSLDYSLNSIEKRIRYPETDLKLCFFEYKEDGMPTNKEIAFMVDQAYVHSDITPIPILQEFVDKVSNVSIVNKKKKYSPNEKKFNQFLDYVKTAIETIEQRNNKPIMGYIPDYPYGFHELIELYVNSGINTFYYDADGSSPITIKGALRALLRELNANAALEKSFIHMINPNYGRGGKDSSYIPAKDILGFGVGIDSLGEKHIQWKPTREIAEQLKKNPDNRSRLFDKSTYGYLKTSDAKLIDEFYPNDSGIDIEQFKTGKKPPTKIQNSFNMEQLALESIKLKEKISKEQKILKYIESKKHVKEEDLKILKRFKIKDKK